MRLISLFLFSSIALAQTPTPIPQPPQIVISQDEFNFGKVAEGSVVEHIYTIKNTGGVPLTFSKVFTACGCTTADIPPAGILTGAEAPIKLTFDSLGFNGPVEKSARLYTNDPKTPFLDIKLKGEVEALVSSVPQRLFWGDIKELHRIKPKQIVITPANGVKIIDISQPESIFKLSNCTEGNGSKNCSVTITEDEKAPGDYRDKISVTYEKKGEQGKKIIPLQAKILEDIQTEPKAVVFGVVPKNSGQITKTIKLYSTNEKDFDISKIDINTDQVTVSYDKQSSGNYIVSFKVDSASLISDIKEQAVVRIKDRSDPVLLTVIAATEP